MLVDTPISDPPQVKSAATVEIGQELSSQCDAIAQAVVDRQYQLHPELDALFGTKGRKKSVEDTSHHLAYLAEALATSTPALFHDYVAWTKVLLVGRGLPVQDFIDNLHATTDILRQQLPPESATVASQYIESALAALPEMPAILPSAISPTQPLAELANSFLTALLAFERNDASHMILNAVHNGTSIKDIYIQVFQQSLQEIGRLWQMNQVTVAQEHYCTAATQMIMSQLYPQIFSGPRIGRSFVGTSVSGDLHEIGIRMIADFFEMDGWDTVFLGADVPIADLIKTLQQHTPDVLGISATLTPHVADVAKIISAIRAAPALANIKILVGGYPFLIAPDLWKKVGADGACNSAQGVVDLANRLMLQRKAA